MNLLSFLSFTTLPAYDGIALLCEVFRGRLRRAFAFLVAIALNTLLSK